MYMQLTKDDLGEHPLYVGYKPRPRDCCNASSKVRVGQVQNSSGLWIRVRLGSRYVPIYRYTVDP